MRQAFLFCLVACLLASSASGQVIGPYPTSTSTTIPLDFFGSYPNLAGFVVGVQVLDPGELDVLGVTYGGAGTIGPLAPSQPLTGTFTTSLGPVRVYMFWLSSLIPTPVNFSGTSTSLFQFTFHPKGFDNGTTTASPNPDFRLAAGAISHLTSSGIFYTGQPYFSKYLGNLLAVESSTTLSTSSFFVEPVKTKTVGYDIRVSPVPEPASFLLMGCGLLGLLIGVRMRRERKQTL